MKIANVLAVTPYVEDDKTRKLFLKLAHVKTTGSLTKEELLLILKWKSPRPLRFYDLNTEKEIKEITSLAFGTKNDCLKLHILTALKGVNYPSASAVLMFYDHRRFPVLDIRVWKQLYSLGLVNENARGQNFTISQCGAYLKVIRSIAKDAKLTARQVEKRLFDYDKKVQKGPLYKTKVHAN